MEFRTLVETGKAGFKVQPCEEVLLVGSCFADGIGQRFREEAFPATTNPYGTMYNPASVLHTVERYLSEHTDYKPRVTFLTLGTNHVYRLRETGQIVDNCRKRPQSLFQEEELGVNECADYLRQAVSMLQARNPEVHVVLTVSPIRYRKYGYHGSQLSKATLLLAIRELCASHPSPLTDYFPAYEIFMDELRDYRFYAPDMLHPSAQAVDYVWERLVDWCFSSATRRYLDEWRPLKQLLAHRPSDPEAPDYKQLMDKTMLKVARLREKYPTFAL